MSNVTIHNFTKTEKPISVDGKPFGKAYLESGVWQVYDLAGRKLNCACEKSSLLEQGVRRVIAEAAAKASRPQY